MQNQKKQKHIVHIKRSSSEQEDVHHIIESSNLKDFISSVRQLIEQLEDECAEYQIDKDTGAVISVDVSQQFPNHLSEKAVSMAYIKTQSVHKQILTSELRDSFPQIEEWQDEALFTETLSEIFGEQRFYINMTEIYINSTWSNISSYINQLKVQSSSVSKQ